ncbi:MAG TPA: hypothetical protein VF614_00680 [Chthoniobacteraceae bacterium]|jgi:hypothetical protein
MSIQIRGRDPRTQLIRRPGGALNLMDDGSWEGREKFTCAWTSVRRLAPIRNLTPHQEFPTLLCTLCGIVRTKAGMADLDVTYRGLFDAPPPTLEPTTSTGEQPVETHDLFRDVSEEDQEKIRNYFEKGGTKPTLTGSAQKLFQKKLKGIASYVAPSTIVKVVTLSAGQPFSIADVGTVYQGIPIDLPNQYMSWLKTSKTWRRLGGMWITQEDYQLSGRNGWDADLY